MLELHDMLDLAPEDFVRPAGGFPNQPLRDVERSSSSLRQSVRAGKVHRTPTNETGLGDSDE
jgi:hypothetical protein